MDKDIKLGAKTFTNRRTVHVNLYEDEHGHIALICDDEGKHNVKIALQTYYMSRFHELGRKLLHVLADMEDGSRRELGGVLMKIAKRKAASHARGLERNMELDLWFNYLSIE
jgi:hypothetical protein